MTDTANAPERIKAWMQPYFSEIGSWSTTRYPEVTIEYVLATHCDELVAAARAEGALGAQAKIARLTEAALFLWGLLDDIDTLDDMCRDDDNGFRIRTRNSQKRRFEVGTTDGYTVTLAALQENANE